MTQNSNMVLESIDRRLQHIEDRLGRVEGRLDSVEVVMKSALTLLSEQDKQITEILNELGKQYEELT